METNKKSGFADVNGARLYYEVSGHGPSVLLIHGTGLDGGCFDDVAPLLASDFTVVTYDRRGYSRSPRPKDWEKTSIEEQSKDAAELLRALGAAPAAVLGTSSSGLIALDLLLRHAPVVRGVVLYEPSMFSVLPDLQEQFAPVTPIIERGMAAGGPRGGLEALWGLIAGDPRLGFVPAQLRERWLSNADLVFGMEFPNMLLAYRPDAAALAAQRVPVQVMRASESLPLNLEAAEWLAGRLKVELGEVPGMHLSYLDRPREFAGAIRPFFEQVSASQFAAI